MEELAFGTTEYVLFSVWMMFTAGMFTLLYKITQEADEDLKSTQPVQEK